MGQEMNRRGFLGAILAAGVAPAFVRSPMRLFVPKHALWGAGAIGSPYNLVMQENYNEIMRHAFIPGLTARIYKTTPLMVELMQSAGVASFVEDPLCPPDKIHILGMNDTLFTEPS
jgi:hypothetical protein